MVFANFIGSLVPFFWFVLACIAFLLLFPVAKQMIESGSLNKVKVGVVELELTRVVKKVSNVEIEIAQQGRLGEPEPIIEKESKRISDRFAGMADKLRGATILWVDDYIRIKMWPSEGFFSPLELVWIQPSRRRKPCDGMPGQITMC